MIKLPREGTISKSIVDALIEAEDDEFNQYLHWSDLHSIYKYHKNFQGNPRFLGQALSRILRKYAVRISPGVYRIIPALRGWESTFNCLCGKYTLSKSNSKFVKNNETHTDKWCTVEKKVTVDPNINDNDMLKIIDASLPKNTPAHLTEKVKKAATLYSQSLALLREAAFTVSETNSHLESLLDEVMKHQ